MPQVLTQLWWYFSRGMVQYGPAFGSDVQREPPPTALRQPDSISRYTDGDDRSICQMLPGGEPGSEAREPGHCVGGGGIGRAPSRSALKLSPTSRALSCLVRALSRCAV